MLKVLTKKLKKSKGGFTLIELIVVIAILAILAIVLVPTIAGNVSKAQDAAANTTAQSIFSAAQLYQNDADIKTTKLTSNKAYVKTDDDVITMFKSKYFSSIPLDNLKTLTINTGEDGAIKSVLIMDKDGHNGQYPVAASSSASSK